MLAHGVCLLDKRFVWHGRGETQLGRQHWKFAQTYFSLKNNNFWVLNQACDVVINWSNKINHP